jgi:hypothetical protein
MPVGTGIFDVTCSKRAKKSLNLPRTSPDTSTFTAAIRGFLLSNLKCEVRQNASKMSSKIKKGGSKRGNVLRGLLQEFYLSNVNTA